MGILLFQSVQLVKHGELALKILAVLLFQSIS
jgi:hypothetical protein